jgi:hypothetical protein
MRYHYAVRQKRLGLAERFLTAGDSVVVTGYRKNALVGAEQT